MRILFSIVLLALTSWVTASADSIPARVLSVHDGDTLTALIDGHGTVIRLEGIDAPELSQPDGPEAAAWLKRKLPPGSPILLITSTSADIYGRTLATVFHDGQDICRAEIEAGSAWYFIKYKRSLTATQREDYQEAEDAAKSAALGLWADSEPVAPWLYRKSLRK